MDDGHCALEGFWRVEGVVLLEDIHKGMLPLADVVHFKPTNLNYNYPMIIIMNDSGCLNRGRVFYRKQYARLALERTRLDGGGLVRKR